MRTVECPICGKSNEFKATFTKCTHCNVILKECLDCNAIFGTFPNTITSEIFMRCPTCRIDVTNLSPTANDRHRQSELQRRRNSQTIKVSRVSNGFLTTNGDTGQTSIAIDLDSVFDVIEDFFNAITTD